METEADTERLNVVERTGLEFLRRGCRRDGNAIRPWTDADRARVRTLQSRAVVLCGLAGAVSAALIGASDLWLQAVLVRGGERVALLGSGVPPSGNKVTLNRLAMTLVEGQLPRDGLPAVPLLPRHAQAVLIGDLLSPLEEIQRTVAAFSGRGVRGHLVQVLDPAEETLPFAGRIEFEGLEGEEELLIPRVEAVRQTYLERLEAHRDGLAALARAAGWSFATHRTDRPPQTALLALHGAIAQAPKS